MKWIAITSPDFLPGEASAIVMLLQSGINIVHLRKPQADISACQKLIEEIPSQYYPYIVLHEHFELCDKYHLRGIHLNSRNGTIPFQFEGHISCSCHSFQEIKEKKEKADYVFLSPIFDSISKQGYKSAFTIESLQQAKREGIIDSRVVALGGIAADKIPMLRSLSFGGAALMGDLWNRYQTDGPSELKKHLKILLNS